MSDKLRSVKLTERQWDHVLISLSNSVLSAANNANIDAKNNWDQTGMLRAVTRFDDVSRSISGQLGWQPSEIKDASTWELCLKPAQPEQEDSNATD